MRVISNTAIALDGRINTKEGGFTSLGSPRDHARMSELRCLADAVLVGGATFRNWPHPSLPDASDLEKRQRPWPLFNVILTRTLQIPLSAAYLAESRIRPLILCPEPAPAGFPVEVLSPPGGGRDLASPWVLETLRGRGVETLLVEGGGDLLFQFLAAGALDELYVTLCPKLIGGRGVPSLADGAGFTMAELPQLRLRSAEVVGDELFLHYAVARR